MYDEAQQKIEKFQSNIWFCVLYNDWLVALNSVIISKIILTVHTVREIRTFVIIIT